MLSDGERQALRIAAGAVLRDGWREGTRADGARFAYTRPAARYPDQFFWDSCFHAVAWSRIDPARARAELRTLVAAQRPDGLIGHTVFWHGRVRAMRAPIYNIVGRDDATTRTIQPPLLGWAWEQVAARSPDDPGFAAEGIAPVAALHGWLERERAGPDGLIGILQPDESGMDASPAYDGPLGLRAHGRPGFMRVLRFNRRRGCRYRDVVADGGFHAIDPLVNTALALSWAALGRLGTPTAPAGPPPSPPRWSTASTIPAPGCSSPRAPTGGRCASPRGRRSPRSPSPTCQPRSAAASPTSTS